MGHTGEQGQTPPPCPLGAPKTGTVTLGSAQLLGLSLVLSTLLIYSAVNA